MRWFCRGRQRSIGDVADGEEEKEAELVYVVTIDGRRRPYVGDVMRM